VISTAQHKYGASSLSIPSGAYINFANSADWQFGSGRFTIEGWFYLLSDSGAGTILGLWNSGQLSWVVLTEVTSGDGKLHWATSIDGSSANIDITGATTLVANTWNYWAVDFDGAKYRLYLNGVMDGSFVGVRNLFASTAVLSMGESNSPGGNQFIGYLDEIRITKGVARYASDTGFVVPTAAFPRHA
jgi:hypothetical protein